MHIATLKHLTIRSVPEDLYDALHAEKDRSGKSLNQTVIDLLRQRLGLGGSRSNGLARLAGGWTQHHLEQFQKGIEPLENIDTDMWR